MTQKIYKHMIHILVTLALICTFSINSFAQPGTYQIGMGTGSNGQFDYPAPYGNYWWGARHQFIIRKAELISLGFNYAASIPLDSIGFNVTATNGTPPHQGFTISLKNSNTNDLTLAWETGMTTVVNPFLATPTVGWNMFKFDNKFCWDTSQNLIVEVCFNNTSFTSNASTQFTTGLPVGTTRLYNADVAGVCASTSLSQVMTTRTNMRITCLDTIITYQNTTASQSASSALRGVNNFPVLLATVNLAGISCLPGSGLNVSEMTFNTNGTTDTADISNARLFYTNTPVFSTANQVGSTIANPSGTLTFTFSQNLSSTGYFWLTYDVSGTATFGNLLDAEYTSITIDNVPQTPILSSPPGAVLIRNPLNGNYTVGALGDFISITEAIQDAKSVGINGPVTLRLIDPMYSTSNGEVFPITISGIDGISNVNTLTIRPDSNIHSLIIDSNTFALFVVENIKYVNIDGRWPGQSDSSRNLTIQNLNNNTNNNVIVYRNEASNHVLRNTIIRYANPNTSTDPPAAAILIGGTTNLLGVGNDSISIIGNAFAPSRNFFHAVSVLSRGEQLTQQNDWIRIDSNWFYGHRVHGISLPFANNGNGRQFQIRANHFFDTTTTVPNPVANFAFNYSDINIASSNSNSFGHIITGNFFGGQAPYASGGYREIRTANDPTINHIFYSGSVTTGGALIANNIMQNIAYNRGAPAAFYTINPYAINGGFIDILSNIYGHLTDTNSIISENQSGGGHAIFQMFHTAPTNIKHNVVSNVTVNSNTAINFLGMRMTGTTIGECNMDSNTVRAVFTRSNSTSAFGPTIGALVAFGLSNGSQSINFRGNVAGGPNPQDSLSVFSSSPFNPSVSVPANTRMCGIVNNSGIVLMENNFVGHLYTNSNAGSGLTNSAMAGIYTSSFTGGVVVNNNIVTDLHARTPTAAPICIIGIGSASAASTISNNTIRNIFSLSTATGTITAASLNGIMISSSQQQLVLNNRIENLNNLNTAASTQTNAILMAVSTSASVARGNYVYNVHSASSSASTGTSIAITGINVPNSAPNQTVDSNYIFNLVSTNSGSAVNSTIAGVVFQVSANLTGNNSSVTRNRIWGLTHTYPSSGTPTTAIQYGVLLTGGTATIANNMIRMGIDSAGVRQARPGQYRGIHVTTGGSNQIRVYHNSVHINYLPDYGISGSPNPSSSCIEFTTSPSGLGFYDVKNNIFSNTSADAGVANIRNYSEMYTGTNVLITSNNNIWHNSQAPNSFIGRVGTINHAAANAFRIAMRQAGASGFGNPSFINADTATLLTNLALTSSNPAEKGGDTTVLNFVSLDIDGSDRSSFGPADIGAKAGNYTLSLDVNAPNIFYTPLTNVVVPTVRTFTATIYDGIAVPSSPANAPRVYFKKPAQVTWQNTPGVFVSGTANSSTYQFTIDHALIGGVTPGDIVQYYVIAADSTAGNINSNPAFAEATGVGTVTTHPVAPNTYLFNNPIPATVYVGTGAGTPSFPTLTGAGGLFEAINNSALVGNTTVLVQANITEPGNNQLNRWLEIGDGGYQLTIRPASNTQYILNSTAANTNGILRFSNTDNVRILGWDSLGTPNDTNLIIRNNSTSSPLIAFINGGSTDTIRNVILEGRISSTVSGMILIRANDITATRGVSNVLIDKCIFRPDATSLPLIGVYSVSTSPLFNQDITVSNNRFQSVNQSMVVFTTGSGNNLRVQNNHMYFVNGTHTNATLTPILLNMGNTSNSNIISGNFIGGTEAFALGTPWTNNASINFNGISVNTGSAAGTQINNNVIQNFNLTNTTGTTAANGIFAQGTNANYSIVGNRIGSMTFPILSNLNHRFNAINTNTTGNVNIQNDTILNVSVLNTGTTAALAGIVSTNISAATAIINNNVISNLYTTSTNIGTANTTLALIGIASTHTTLNLSISNNEIRTLIAPSTSTILVRGIWSSSGTPAINNNTVYGISTNSSATGTITTAAIAGIMHSSGSNGFVSINDNVIDSIWRLGSLASVQVMGIAYLPQGITQSASVSRNRVSNINAITSNINTALTSALTGIMINATGTVNANYNENEVSVVNHLSNSISHINGMVIANSASLVGNNSFVSRNLIHSLRSDATSVIPIINGIHTTNGFLTYANNMIRLGLDSAAVLYTHPRIVRGFWHQLSTQGFYYHNTVLISGAPDAANATTSAFESGFQILSGQQLDVRNNIFVNRTSNTGTATGFNFGIRYQDSLRINSNNNIIFVDGIGGVHAYIASTNSRYVLLANDSTSWQARVGLDLASASVNPNFTSSAVAAAPNVLLTLQNNNPAERSGDASVPVAVDYFGVARSGLTPSDIGAHAGNFNMVPDAFGPQISYTPLTNAGSIIGSRQLNNVTITDNNGIVMSGTNRPRIYYSNDRGATWLSAGATTVAGTATNAVANFVIDYLTFTTPLIQTDTILYFVAAQDAAGNVRTFPHLGVGTSVNNITQYPAVPSFFAFLPVLPANTVIPVGVGQTYTSLTNPGGLFEFINSRTLGGNITIEIVSDINNESGAVALNKFAEDGIGSGTYTLTIRPNASTTSPRTIQGSYSNTNGFSLVTLLGADRVKILGIPTGGNPSDRMLRIRNTAPTATYAAGTGAGVITVSSASGVALRNLIIESGNSNTAGGNIEFRAGIGNLFATTPCSFDTVDNCILTNNKIANLPNGIPANAGIYSFGNPNVYNNNIIITNNLISNFVIAGVGVVTNNGDGFVISNNSLFYDLGFVPNIPNATIQAIVFIPGSFSSGNIISNNFIGGSAPNCGGSPFANSNQFGFNGIRTNVGNGSVTTISNNTIQNINFSNPASTLQFQAIVGESGNTSIVNNQIGHPTITNSITWLNTGAFFGVRYFGSQIITCQDNTVQGINMPTPNQFNQFSGISITGGVITGDFSGNTVGHSTTANSITVSSNTTNNGIQVSVLAAQTPQYNFRNNLVSNISSIGNGTNAFFNGVNLLSGASVNMFDNTIKDLSSLGTATTTTGVLRGLFISGLASAVYNVSANTIHAIRGSNTSSAAYSVYGICLSGGILNASANRIYDITNISTSISVDPAPIASAIGIASGSGVFTIQNNMIVLGVGQNTNTQFVGIHHFNNNSAATLNVYNNSVVIQGIATGNLQTYAFLHGNNTGTQMSSFNNLRNNIFVNARSGGSGSHYAVANQTSSPTNFTWLSNTSQFNLYATANANTVAEWGIGANTITAWRSNSTTDQFSYYVQTGTSAGQLNISNLFANVSSGNLNLNATSNEVWYVYGKGITGSQIGNLNSDFTNNMRNTNQGFATTIGASHLSTVPSSLPIAASASAAPAPNTTTNYTFASRPVASITWGASAPSSITIYDFTGVNPPAAPAGNVNNRYVRADVSGGTPPYNYGVSYNFNAANTGGMLNGNNLRLATSNQPTPTSWTTQFTTTSNASTGLATVSGLTSTGPSITFTGTELAAPATITAITPSAAPVGGSVTIIGSLFTGATALSFNGTPQTTFTLVNDTAIITTVPSGATTGPVSITNPFGVGTSAFNFVVIPAPTVTAFTPSSGTFGTSVTVTGSGFTWATGVSFNGVAASFNVVNNTTITTVVPTGATTGVIRVINPADSAASPSPFTVFPVPSISSFTPGTGSVGTSVTINGTEFNAITNVRFNGVNASFSVISATEIQATVPSGATTGSITVINGSGTATSSTNFVVTTPPTITGFTPSSGGPGATVVISGTNFTGTDTVYFNTTPTFAFIINSSTQITATVPTGATTGPITVVTSQGIAVSTATYTVIPDLIVNSIQSVSGTYNNITVTGTGVANLTGTLTALGNTVVQTGGRIIFGNEVLNGIGSFTTQAGSILEVGSAAGISLAGTSGNVQVNGTRTINTSTSIIFNGSGNQTSGDAIVTVDTLTINASGNVSLQSNVTVNRTLNMFTGNLILGSNNLTIAPTGNIIGANAASYIQTNGIGALHRTVANNATNVVFPVGTSAYTPTQVQFTIGSTTDVVSVRVFNGVLALGGTGSPIFTSMVNRTWIINESVPGGSNATITLTWDDTLEVGAFSRSQSAISSYDNVANLWRFTGAFAAATGANPYSRSLSGITSLTFFTVGDTFATPLPVHFVGVNATALSDDVLVEWSTAGEFNNEGFYVERSEDGLSFVEVGFVAGTNTSNLVKYSHNDAYAFSSTAKAMLYYRLRQVDFDGSVLYSKTVSATRTDKLFTKVNAYPNPFKQVVNIEIVSIADEDIIITVSDMQGRIVATKNTSISRGQNQVLIEELETVKAGVYFVKISGSESQVLKVVKTN